MYKLCRLERETDTTKEDGQRDAGNAQKRQKT